MADDDEITDDDEVLDEEEDGDVEDLDPDEDEIDDDDVEADLDRILKDRMVTADDEDDEEEEEDDSDPRAEGGEKLQPKQQDEQLCSQCFLLVRSNAPNCPVGADDDCPIFS
ncbi:MAG: hypothetical protein AAGF91_07140 [Actinomycetota bacterium]